MKVANCITFLFLIASSSSSMVMAQKPKVWGFATSAYQIEGAWNVDGKVPSIWDDFTHKGLATNKESGDIAVDHYHKWKEDYQLLKQLGANSYRMSLSWTRIVHIENGTVNQAGVQFYKQQLQELKRLGIEPYVTLYHWDLPLVFQEKLGGWTDKSRQIVKEFVNYSEIAFTEFKDLVTYWMTFNEPAVFCELGYRWGLHAPGLKLLPSEFLQCGHNVLLAHGASVKILRDINPKAKVGLALNSEWGEPMNPNNPLDVQAAQNFVSNGLGWFADPIFKGDYPKSLRSLYGNDVPRFCKQQIDVLKESVDFFGLNFYTGKYVSATNNDPVHFTTSHTSPDGKPIGNPAVSSWLFDTPKLFENMLVHITKTYNAPDIFITENGFSSRDADQLKDTQRQAFYKGYLDAMMSAIQKGAQVKGYFAWSLLDNFEWAQGFGEKFGVVAVDLSSPQLTRTIKDSATFLSNFFNQN